MILPIVAYGDPVLRKRAQKVDKNHPGLQEFIDNLFETMYHSHGVGLAAPQVGQSLRIFVADSSPMDGVIDEDSGDLKDWKRVFINPVVKELGDDEWSYEEGCLSIPDVRENVWRSEKIKITYFNEKFEKKEETLSMMKARIVLHEFDHIEGVLFLDHVSALKRQLLKGRLGKISRGQIEPRYPMRFPKTK
jgi:peptide deformylase